jgi:hypothetical protein
MVATGTFWVIATNSARKSSMPMDVDVLRAMKRLTSERGRMWLILTR